MKEKPATIRQREFQEKIIEAINTSDLPAFVLASTLEQILAEVRRIEQQQYEADKAEYEEAD